jgi:hypothetical protein
LNAYHVPRTSLKTEDTLMKKAKSLALYNFSLG